MKEYKKMMKIISKDTRFEIRDSKRKNTVKLVHRGTGRIYSIHPSNNAVRPVQKWIKNITK